MVMDDNDIIQPWDPQETNFLSLVFPTTTPDPPNDSESRVSTDIETSDRVLDNFLSLVSSAHLEESDNFDGDDGDDENSSELGIGGSHHGDQSDVLPPESEDEPYKWREPTALEAMSCPLKYHLPSFRKTHFSTLKPVVEPGEVIIPATFPMTTYHAFLRQIDVHVYSFAQVVDC